MRNFAGCWEGAYMSRHCATCGANYTPMMTNDDEAGVREVFGSHECPLPHGQFFVINRTEYEYKEGTLYERQVSYRRYSGHDTPNYMLTNEATPWVKSEKEYVK